MDLLGTGKASDMALTGTSLAADLDFETGDAAHRRSRSRRCSG